MTSWWRCSASWATAFKYISLVYLAGGDYIGVAAQAAGELYGDLNVLFKQTKAAEVPLRPTEEDALSYCVGDSAVQGGYDDDEDAGFVINGGMGWSNVRFDNHKVELFGGGAIVMDAFFFTSAADSSVTKVEYTFSYESHKDGKPRICLNHTSLPYSAAVGTKV